MYDLNYFYNSFFWRKFAVSINNQLMKNIFVINGGQNFAHSGGSFNKTITNWTKEVLENENFEFRISNVNDEFDATEEAENFKWADVVVYHFRFGGFRFRTV